LGWSISGDNFFNACEIYNGNPFITTWEVTANDLSITIPTNGAGFNYGIDFGDGYVTDNIHGNVSHTYEEPGIYTVKIAGDFPRIFFSISTHKDKILSVDQWGDIEWHSKRHAFLGCSNLEINATDAPNLTQVTDMSYAFSNTGAFNQSINHWDVSNVINMEGMFESATLFNQSLDNWNVANVTDMSDMFKNATLFNQDLTNWTFNSAVSLEGFLSNSGLDIGNYDLLLEHFANEMLENKTLGADNLIYCEKQFRVLLRNDRNWKIYGDTQDEACILSLPENCFEEVKIYPNPVNDVLYVVIPQDTDIERITLYNINGQIIKIIDQTFQEIPMGGLSSGIYFLEFHSADRNQIKQVIKK
jgi:hypothetical protein